MEFNLTGDQRLDPSTFRVMFQLSNAGNIGAAEGTAQKQLEPLSWNPAICFRRCRLSAGSNIIEYIDEFNRLSLMLTALRTQEEQNTIAGEGFCNFDYTHAAEQKMILVQLIARKVTTKLAM